MKILIATTNIGKRTELIDLLKEIPAEIVTPRDLKLTLEVEESGQTYAENASLKALAYCEASGLVSLADDTGLEVDALGGRPGVFSARYVETPDATDADRRAKLLGELKPFPRPWTALFHCTVAIAAPGAELQLFNSDIRGEIVPLETGKFGFGYDSLFYIPSVGKTLASCTMVEKNYISHRALAVKLALPYLKSLLSTNSTN
jgi:XTP/dITP diphosphohydrolase